MHHSGLFRAHDFILNYRLIAVGGLSPSAPTSPRYAHAVFLSSVGGEADRLRAALPAGRSSVCLGSKSRLYLGYISSVCLGSKSDSECLDPQMRDELRSASPALVASVSPRIPVQVCLGSSDVPAAFKAAFAAAVLRDEQ